MLKKIFAVLLALLVPIGAAQAASIAVAFTDTAALIDAEGAQVLAPGLYATIFALDEEGNYFCGGVEGENGFSYALLDAQGNALTGTDYEMLSYRDGYVLFLQDGLYGAMLPDGEVVVSAAYTQLVTNGQGGFLALNTDCFDDQPDGLYLLDAQGNSTATGVKTVGMLDQDFREGLMPLLSAENNLYGYVDASGQWAVRPQFAYASSFLNGRAVASLSTGYGLIDLTGNWVLTPKYATLVYDDAKLAVAVQDDSPVLGFDPLSGAERFRIEGEAAFVSVYDGMIQVFDGQHATLYDYDGNRIYEGSPAASYAAGVAGDYILSDGQWGAECAYILDAAGTVQAGPYKALFPLFSLDGKGYYCFMTFDAQRIYDEALDVEYYEWDESSVRYGVIDEAGNTCIEARFEELWSVGSADLMLAREGEILGVIDLTGNWVYRFDGQ